MINLVPIAYVESPFKEKFGIPRQAGLTPNIYSYIKFEKQFSDLDAFRELEGFSHIWITFCFHKFSSKGFSSVVRPPRLGGNQKIGVFATRSPNRPNHLGLSKVKLLKINKINDRVILKVEGLDALDGTPILDIKPYIKEDQEEMALFGWTTKQIKNESCSIQFSKRAQDTLSQSQISNLKEQIIEVLTLDPAPQYKGEGPHGYGMVFYNYNIKWINDCGIINVTDINLIKI